jgi:hypothetical protein
MATKFLYIVDHYIPFPSSEYGGIWNVIAKDENECFDLITAEDDDAFYEKYYNQLRENIINARKLELVEDFNSRVLEQFIT